jgi:outer membrane protein OmpA-like peptidoglycan-associated protein
MRYLLPLLAALSLVLVGACSTPEETSETTASTGAAEAPVKKKKKKKKKASGSPFTVYFKFDSTDMTEKSHGAVFDILQKVRSYKPKRVEIIAHADKPGTDEYNMNLSQERADALAKMFKGAGAKKIKALGVGESEPIVDTDMRSQTNRRAIISFKKK